MTIEKLPIDEASDQQLRAFATDFLQIELGANVSTRAQILAEIDKAWKQPFINVESDDALLLDEQVERAKPAAKRLGILQKYPDDPLVELEIASTTLPGGDKPVPVNVNGGNLLIPRETRVEIPYRFFLALKDAHEVELTQNKDTMELVKRRVTNYPLTIHRMPTEAEIAEFHRKVDGTVLGRHAKAPAKAA